MSTNRPRGTLIVRSTDHAIGPTNASVTVIEYGDFECPSCKSVEPAVRMMRDRFAKDLRFVFRHYPLEAAHPHALAAAEAAECADGQGQFWPMHRILFERQLHLDRRHLESYAAQLGLEMPRFIAELDDHVYLQRIREQIDAARALHLHATPTFFINGIVHDVSFGAHALLDGVAALLS